MEESAKKSFRKVGLRYGATLDRINDSRTSEKNHLKKFKEKEGKTKEVGIMTGISSQK